MIMIMVTTVTTLNRNIRLDMCCSINTRNTRNIRQTNWLRCNVCHVTFLSLGGLDDLLYVAIPLGEDVHDLLVPLVDDVKEALELDRCLLVYSTAGSSMVELKVCQKLLVTLVVLQTGRGKFTVVYHTR